MVVCVVGIAMRRVLRDLWGLGTTEFGWTLKTDDGSFNAGILKTPIIDHTDEDDALAALVSEFGQRSGSQPT